MTEKASVTRRSEMREKNTYKELGVWVGGSKRHCQQKK